MVERVQDLYKQCAKWEKQQVAKMGVEELEAHLNSKPS
jgi:hypothetical protein